MLAKQHHNVCAVGDDDQSIYGWRGADISNILNFERDFPDAKVVRLEQNYRSTGTILKAAGAVVKNNRHRKGKELWTENSQGERISVAELADEKDEAEWIRAVIANAIGRGRKYGDIVVLYRTNAQSRSIEEAFVRSAVPVPYTVVGGLRFYERKEIRDVLAYLRLIDNPRDSESLRRIINVPKRGIGNRTMEIIARRMGETGATLLETLRSLDEQELGPRVSKPILELVVWLDKLIACKDEISVDKLLETVLTESGYRRELEGDASVEAETRLQNIAELAAGAAAYAEANNEASVSAFLEEIALVADADQVKTDDATMVTLMTLHSAKGLEFPIVFISGIEEGLFPIAGAMQDNAEIEEERRLFYVGLTRAEEQVSLSYAQRRRRFNEWLTMQPSRFLAEIPSNLLSWEKRAAVPQSGMHAGSSERERNSVFSSTRPLRTQAVRTPRDEFSQDSQHIDDFSQTTEEMLAIGRHVIHPMFGRGRITAKEGMGYDTKIVIRFDNGQTKKVVARMAHLEPCI
jgi:DNA helicase-2/ATP-dependent DNA helicase PcrA